MTDANEDGIPDKVEKTFKKGLIVGTVVGVFGGGAVLSLLVYFVPSLAGLLAVFAGGACKPVQVELNHYKEAWSCIEGGAAIQGTDISVCAAKIPKVVD